MVAGQGFAGPEVEPVAGGQIDLAGEGAGLLGGGRLPA